MNFKSLVERKKKISEGVLSSSQPALMVRLGSKDKHGKIPWVYVFSKTEGHKDPVTTMDRTKAIHGDDQSLEYFKKSFANHEFAIQKNASQKMEEVFNQKAADWYNKTFIPALKKHSGGGIDMMMVHADKKGKVQVFTKMYKSGYVQEIKKAFEEVGIKVLDVQPNEASFRGSVTGQFPPEGIHESLTFNDVKKLVIASGKVPDGYTGFIAELLNHNASLLIKECEKLGLDSIGDIKWKLMEMFGKVDKKNNIDLDYFIEEAEERAKHDIKNKKTNKEGWVSGKSGLIHSSSKITKSGVKLIDEYGLISTNLQILRFLIEMKEKHDHDFGKIVELPKLIKPIMLIGMRDAINLLSSNLSKSNIHNRLDFSEYIKKADEMRQELIKILHDGNNLTEDKLLPLLSHGGPLDFQSLWKDLGTYVTSKKSEIVELSKSNKKVYQQIADASSAYAKGMRDLGEFLKKYHQEMHKKLASTYSGSNENFQSLAERFNSLEEGLQLSDRLIGYIKDQINFDITPHVHKKERQSKPKTYLNVDIQHDRSTPNSPCVKLLRLANDYSGGFFTVHDNGGFGISLEYGPKIKSYVPKE